MGALGGPLPAPRLRVLCFHNEGSAESNFTRPGTEFVKWAQESRDVEICAFDFPGRAQLLKAKRHTSADALARELLLILCRKVGLPMPEAGLFMAFPAPHLPTKQRPWRRSSRLGSDRMREELMSWDRDHFAQAGQIVFEAPGWEEHFLPLFRDDFQLFDTYRFNHAGAPKFEF